MIPISVVPLEAVMIFKMYSWPLGDFGCGIATLLSELVTYVSIVTMIMFSIERYVIKNHFRWKTFMIYLKKSCGPQLSIKYIFRYFVICHPQKSCVLSGKRRTKAIVALIWVVCMLPAMIWWNSAKVCFFNLMLSI